MKNPKWDKKSIELIKAYLTQGYNYGDIAKKMNSTYNAVEHIIRRNNLQSELIIQKEDRGLKPKEVLAKSLEIGKYLYENYKKIKLIDPKPAKNICKREEQSILDLSDLHIGMINEVFDSDIGKNIITYNGEIFKEELEVLIKSIKEIHKILSNSYKLKTLTINLMGDIVTNDRIFDEQVFEIEKPVGLQVWDTINYLIYTIQSLLEVYENIKIVCVVGNHGRSLPDSYEEPVENNFEYFIYKTLEKQYENSKRVEIVVPNSRRYIYNILKWKHLIEHGDSLRTSSPTGLEKQIKDLSINVGGFDIFHFGHFHKLKDDEISDKVIVKQNGSWIYKDNYAFKKYKYYSIPKQWFFGCNENRPETWAYKLDLRKIK